jgi:MFS family permease
VAFGFGRFAYTLLLPAMRAEMHLSYTAAGLLATANLVAYLLGAAAAGFVVPRSAIRILFPGALLVAGMALCLLAVPSYSLGVLAMTVLGITSAMAWISSVTMLNSWPRQMERGVLLSISSIGAGWGIAIVAGMDVLATALYGEAAWHWVWLAAGLTALAAGTVAMIALRQFGVASTSARLPIPRIWHDLKIPSVAQISVVYALFGLGYSAFLSFFVAFLQRYLHVSGSILVWASLGIAAGLGGLVVGVLSDRWGRRPTLVASIALTSIATGLPILSTSPLAIAAAAVMFGLPMVGLGSVVASYLGDQFANAGRAGRAFAVATVLFGSGQAIGPAVAGMLLDTTGSFSAPFVLATIIMVIATGCSLFLPEASRRVA